MSSNIRVQRICQHCGKEFTARTTITKHCGDICSKRAYKARVKAVKIEAVNSETKQVKQLPIDDLKAKAFLSIAETSRLIGISRRTVYRLIERGDLEIGKAGSRTIIRRSDLEKLLFEKPQTAVPQLLSRPEMEKFDISNCYNLTEVQSKYGISESALQNLIKRNEIPKFKMGRFVYISQKQISIYLNETK